MKLQALNLRNHVDSMAQRAGMNSSQVLDAEAAQLNSPQAEEFLSSEPFQGSLGLVRSLRLADLPEVGKEFEKRGLSAQTAHTAALALASAALAGQPAALMGIDAAISLATVSPEPGPSLLNAQGDLQVQPALERMAQMMEISSDQLLDQTLQAYREQPHFAQDPKILGQVEFASYLRRDEGDLSAFRGRLAEKGATSEQQDAIASSLLASAVGLEPSFRPGLQGIVNQVMLQAHFAQGQSGEGQ